MSKFYTPGMFPLFNVIVSGGESVYESSLWVISVYYDVRYGGLYCLDGYGDSDLIKYCSFNDARRKAVEFFSRPGYEIYA